MKTVFTELSEAPLNGGYREDGKWVWCGSCVEEPGKGFHLYAARWRKDYPMLEGYVFFSEIVHAFSRTMTGPYHYVETVLPSGNPREWDGSMAHNPTVVKYGNRYLLYYIASHYDETPTPADRVKTDRNLMFRVYGRIRIGMAVADAPGGPWKRLDHPALDVSVDGWDSGIVTNPAPCVLPDGSIYLYYRSNTPGGVRLGLARAKSPEGPCERVFDHPVMTDITVEDPFVWHNGECFEMLSKDMTGKLTGEVHAGAHFLSKNGLDWDVRGKAYSRVVRMADGSLRHLGCLERPQLLIGSDGRPKCLFAAAADGPGGFDRALNTWNLAIPLKDPA